MPMVEGTSEAATGTITSATSSLLSFPRTKRHVVINNRSGQVAYFKLNDAASPVVSATVYDLALSDGGAATVDDFDINTVGVFVAATSGIRVVGW